MTGCWKFTVEYQILQAKGLIVASANCQNYELFLSIAEEVGRKAYFMGVDLEIKLPWYSTEERVAFYAGWIAAEQISFARSPMYRGGVS